MAEENQHQHAAKVVEIDVEDRRLFEFVKKEKEKCEEEMVSEFEKVKLEEDECEVEDEQIKKEEKHGLLEKLHRSNSSSSSSSDEEEVRDGEQKEKKKKKKGLKEKIAEKISGEKEEHEEEIIIVGTQEVLASAVVASHEGNTTVHIEKVEENIEVVEVLDEKKGFLEKIKEKLPRHNKKHVDETLQTTCVVEHDAGKDKEQKEKKGFLEKLMDKIPGYNKNEGGDHGDAAPTH